MIATSLKALEPPRLLYVVNVSWFFISHRLALAVAARAAGYEVHVATSVTSAADADRIRAGGIVLHDVPIGRADIGPVRDARTLLKLVGLFRRVRPQIVHLVAMKAVVFGGLAARFVRVPGVVVAIAGLGTGFAADTGLATRLRRHVLVLLLRMAIRRTGSRILFQNEEDRNVLVASGVVEPVACRVIPGAGVDLAEFRMKGPPPAPPLKVVLPARMLREKGVVVFADAARLLRRVHPTVRFLLAGGLDAGNPGGLTRPEIEGLTRDGDVEWLGHVADMPSLLASCHIVCLPTWYGEGIPKALIEGAAAGLPLVTTSIPGCKDICADGVNGLLVPPRDVQALAGALRRLLDNADLRESMGRAGSMRVAERFSLHAVVSATLAIYAECLSGPQRPIGASV